MITIRLPDTSATVIRFARSPLWEAIAAARLVVGGCADNPLDLGRLCAPLSPADIPTLARIFAKPAVSYTPDFLAPPPSSPAPTFEDELKELRKTPATIVMREITRWAEGTTGREPRAILARGPAALMADVATEAALVWNRVLRPRWPETEGILQGEILLCGQTLAQEGPVALLARLHPAIDMSAGTLRVRGSSTGRTVAARGPLLLVPTVFGAPDVFAVLDPPWPPSVYYPARGAALLGLARPGAPARLCQALGTSRSRVLTALVVPASTVQLAARLRMSASTTSAHLARLRKAGLVRSSRRGHSVVYTLTETGHGLLSVFDSGKRRT